MDSDDELDLSTLRSNIQQCGAALQCVLEHLAKQTGWTFSVLMGGPDPLSPEGENIIMSLHVGKTKGSQDFADLYSNFDREVVEAYDEFLSKVFNDDMDGTVAEEEPEPGCNGEGVGQDDLDAKDENNVDVSDVTQVTTGLATPPTASLERLPSTHLATLAALAALASSPPTACLATPSTHLATPPSVHLATPLSVHLATPLSAHLATQSMNPVQLKSSLLPAHIATLPSAHLATLLSTHLATRAQDVTASDGLSTTMQGIQTPFMDLFGNNLASFDTGMGFDTLWSDPFEIS
ncbi:hypothetical protein PAXRUDRAFT_18668 [Paxillus rubicundulus Ve08.2h10]|uniref:Uncharacterized protein n=1 Tax=Paxillus rubicundulus Ve08.2h10 TaxID=930991 RepID=A0A0D0CKP2_9AGAM|nr:hypothetical protein PAXRUDRAFT_18668 [Paxillus rubicundulus Ve08.2h10]